MKYAFVIIVFIHGLIHLLGFVKGFGLKEIKELTLPISKPMAFLWLAGAVLILAFVIFNLLHSKYAWLVGFAAVLISQVLIILFWKDAKFGTLPNAMIFIASIILFGQFNFQKLVQQETTQLLSQNTKVENRIVSEKDIEHLPNPVKKWLSHCGIVGKPYIYLGEGNTKSRIENET